MKGFQDDRRAVLRAGGADARPLLQDLVTNDIDLARGDALVYAALLTPQGKYMFDFLIGEDGDGLMIDVAADRAQALAQRLAMYRLRRDLTLAADDTPVTLLWGADAPPPGARRDPRSDELGWRFYGPSPAFEPAERADYDALRVRAAVPESGIELIENDSYILEAGFERLNGVDFRKGCYVGQEVTARMKHKTALKKGLVRVSVKGEAPAGTPVEAGGKPVGALFTTVGGAGLAHLRFDRASGEMTAGDARIRMRGD